MSQIVLIAVLLARILATGLRGEESTRTKQFKVIVTDQANPIAGAEVEPYCLRVQNAAAY